METNFFQVTAFFWAAVALTSRSAMLVMGERWKDWEMKGFYKEKRPKYITAIAAAGLMLAAFTWVQVVRSDVSHGWILALLVSLTMVKISALVFNYQGFRRFAESMLNNKSSMRKLNAAVLIAAAALILMGVFLY